LAGRVGGTATGTDLYSIEGPAKAVDAQSGLHEAAHRERRIATLIKATSTWPIAHRSGDRKYVMLVMVLVGAAGPYTMATEPEPATLREWIIASAVCVACWWLGWRAWRTRTVLTEEALTDIRLLRQFVVARTEVVGTSVSRAAGFGEGFCLFPHLRDGGRHQVASTRAYLVAPSRAHLDDLGRFRRTVELWSGGSGSTG
jgi:hypothetical protein